MVRFPVNGSNMGQWRERDKTLVRNFRADCRDGSNSPNCFQANDVVGCFSSTRVYASITLGNRISSCVSRMVSGLKLFAEVDPIRPFYVDLDQEI